MILKVKGLLTYCVLVFLDSQGLSYKNPIFKMEWTLLILFRLLKFSIQAHHVRITSKSFKCLMADGTRIILYVLLLGISNFSQTFSSFGATGIAPPQLLLCILMNQMISNSKFKGLYMSLLTISKEYLTLSV